MFKTLFLGSGMYETVPVRKHKNIVRIVQYDLEYIEVQLRNGEYITIKGQYTNNVEFLKKVVKLVNDYCAGRTTLENDMIYACFRYIDKNFNQKFTKWQGKITEE